MKWKLPYEKVKITSLLTPEEVKKSLSDKLVEPVFFRFLFFNKSKMMRFEGRLNSNHFYFSPIASKPVLKVKGRIYREEGLTNIDVTLSLNRLNLFSGILTVLSMKVIFVLLFMMWYAGTLLVPYALFAPLGFILFWYFFTMIKFVDERNAAVTFLERISGGGF